MRVGSKDQVVGVEGTEPRKKWMKKGRLSAALIFFEKTWVSECGQVDDDDDDDGDGREGGSGLLWDADVNVVLILCYIHVGCREVVMLIEQGSC